MQGGNNISSLKGGVIGVLFILILLFPMVDQVFHFSPKKEWVKKELAPTPLLDINRLDFFPNQADTWLNDHVHTRDYLLSQYVQFKELLGSQPFPNKVMKGKGQWLYYGMDSQNYFQGELRYTDEDLEVIKNELLSRTKWCEERGIKYYLAIAPSKHTIYPEYLPVELEKVHQPIRVNQLLELQRENPTLNIIDLKGEMLLQKSERLLYRITDHHWNEWGAYWGYREFMNELGEDFPGMDQPVEQDQLTVKEIEMEGLRLAQVLGKQNEIKEHQVVASITNATFSELELPEEGDKKVGNYEGRFVNENKSRKILFIHDSFADATMKFVPEHFKETVYYFDRYKYGLNKEVVEVEKPDIVVTFIYGSNLGRLVPGKDALR